MNSAGQRTDFDKLAAGTMAGHVIECGPQATGGIFTDWKLVADGWHNIGFPIAECKADGSFVVTKPADTGGLVSPMTVAEQITYETGDPANYILPDVVCDLSNVHVEQVGPNRVNVTGVRGKAPTPTYKVSATYPEGFRSIATLMVNGIDAPLKAQAMGEAILKRTSLIFAREGLADYVDTSIEVLGAEATYGPHSRARTVREVILKVGVRHMDKRAVDIFTREIAPRRDRHGPGHFRLCRRPPQHPAGAAPLFLPAGQGPREDRGRFRGQALARVGDDRGPGRAALSAQAGCAGFVHHKRGDRDRPVDRARAWPQRR